MAPRRRRSRQFTSSSSRSLEERGLAGPGLIVRLEEGVLVLQGQKGGRLEIAPDQVDRLRQFRMEAVHSLHFSSPVIYETKIWWGGARKPAMLVPYGDLNAFRAVLADFAARVAEARGLERLRIGPGWTTAIINLLIVGIPCLLLFAFIFWLALAEGGWWWPAAAGIFMLFFWLAGRNLVSRWPRKVRSLEQFVAELR